MTADEETVLRIREYLALHYETKRRLAVQAEDNFERVRMGLSEWPYDADETAENDTSKQ